VNQQDRTLHFAYRMSSFAIRNLQSAFRNVRFVVYLLPLAFLAVFFFYPLVRIFRVSLTLAEGGGLAALRKLVSTDYYARTLWFTAWQAAVSTLLTVLLALPGAYIFARYEFRGKTLLRALTTVPFVMPTIVVAAAFSSLLGPRGRLNLWLMAWRGLERPPIQLQHTIWIILLAHVFYNYTVVLRMVGGFWANLNPRLEEAARVLGGNRRRVLCEVTLPLLSPAIGAAALLVFVFCFTSFGVVLILGGPRFATLEVEIYRQTVHIFNLPLAAALSLQQILFTLGLMLIYTRLQARLSVPLEFRPRRVTQRRPRTWRTRLLVIVNVAFMLALLVTPLMALVERSLSAAEGGYSFRYYQQLSYSRRGSILFVPPWEAIRNSVIFGAATVILALTLGTPAAHLLARPRSRLTRWLDPLFMLPLAASAVTLGFGYIIALDKPPLNLRASPGLVPLAHTLVALPFVVRSLLPVLRGIQPSLREAAAMLGAPPWRVWREVDLPIVARAMLVGAVFAFTISLGEFGATVLVARPQYPTLPVAIYRFLGQPGAANYGQALAMSSLLMLVCAVGFLTIERFRIGDVGEF
jgi:thiamine transport system permease protein